MELGGRLSGCPCQNTARDRPAFLDQFTRRICELCNSERDNTPQDADLGVYDKPVPQLDIHQEHLVEVVEPLLPVRAGGQANQQRERQYFG